MISVRRVGAGPALGALAIVAAGVLGAACGRPREAPSADSRTAVPLNAEQRDAVLGEMRTMLGSVDGVLRGTVTWDTAGIRAAAVKSGSAAAADPALERILPEQWLQLAMRTHHGFDSLAARIGPGANRDTILARLAVITPECVSCHAMYRLPQR